MAFVGSVYVDVGTGKRLSSGRISDQKSVRCFKNRKHALVRCSVPDSDGSAMDEWNATAYSLLRDRGGVLDTKLVPNSSLTPHAMLSTVLRAVQMNEDPALSAELMLRFSSQEYIEQLHRLITHNGFWTAVDSYTYEKYITANGHSSVLFSFTEFSILDEIEYNESLTEAICNVVLLSSEVHAEILYRVRWSLIRDPVSNAWMTRDIELSESSDSKDQRFFVEGPLYRVKPSFKEPSLTPSSSLEPVEISHHVLCALRANDTPYENHGCDVALRFSSDSFQETLLHLISYGKSKDSDVALNKDSFRKLLEVSQRWYLLLEVLEFAIVEETKFSEDGKNATQKAVFFSTSDFSYQIFMHFVKDKVRCWRIEDFDISPISPAYLDQYYE
eukprot:CAMPEP_0182445490 /NCGR_PEP_ID=MMETSP1172-20130603/3597_1 /TAXON_ID=708627 /ORGANISM="Timspurckia oligopyrenoides, Strain CCMP3278" /LENGTH=386 /DNA_ID=CAMNT_0024641273 /DNA_START=136 /DNA_END=1296 /DNA_ORIENTATION=+